MFAERKILKHNPRLSKVGGEFRRQPVLTRLGRHEGISSVSTGVVTRDSVTVSGCFKNCIKSTEYKCTTDANETSSQLLLVKENRIWHSDDDSI
jgi:hypothetical protein